MKANAAQLKQEAAVLGALTQALTDGYEDYEGDEIFAGFVKNMVDATVDMREHIQNDQFDKFELDVSKMTQSCQQCHSTYR
jgi:cytochrome c556